MSDSYLKLIPTHKDFIPEKSTHKSAISLLEGLTPDGEDVEIEIYKDFTFIDQGQNLEEVICSSCQNSLKQEFFLH